jgi:hypothetical protein
MLRGASVGGCIAVIEQELEKIRHHGEYAGVFQPQFHSFG